MKGVCISVLLLLGAWAIPAVGQELEQNFVIEVTNAWHKAKNDEPVVIRLSELEIGFRVRSAIVREGDREILSQLDDLNGDHRMDELVFLVDLPAETAKRLDVTLYSEKKKKEYPSRVYAQMLVSDKKGKHVPVHAVTIPGTSNIYNQLHHHGPAFESELVAYRLYFDQKQTVDIYGKFNKGFEIKESQFYPTDEQLARGFGDDVLRVSGSCGVGTLKGWDGTKATHVEPVDVRTERILAYGPVRAIVEIGITGWQYQGAELNMTHRYILYGGHRDVCVQTFFEEPLKNEVFCTGVQNIKNSVSYSDHQGLIGCWGTDWPVNDTVKYAKETVGLAAYIPGEYVVEEVKDKSNYLYTLEAPGRESFEHYIMFTSMKETFGYKTPEAWFAYMREWKEALQYPATVRIIENGKKKK